jgi:DNA-binding NarL/FixJ family response regulator
VDDALPLAALSAREEQVLRMLAGGHTNAEIAADLDLSVRTVEMHRQHILQKLSVENRAGIVRYALDHGLLD